ncbi:hypothetical protein ACIGW8_20425 [Streptomyces sioyaensis]|uniref:hypothetical protein n=1 Tax=Streptomyces sioyaensis TaxID=67364 RepID=UPI0037CE5DF8
MVNFLDDQSDSKRFAALLADYDRRLRDLERTSKAAYTSVEGGTLDIYTEDGQLAGSVGVQPDGGIALVPEVTAATPPPTPGAPTVTSSLSGLVVTWDGWWDDSNTPPTDFAAMQVHVGTAGDFTPDVTTLAAAITDVSGGSVTIALNVYTECWVRLLALNTAGLGSAPSAAVSGKARQAVEQDLVDGMVTEVKLAESAVSAAKIALGAVGTTALADGAVLEDKLAKAAVTLGKIANGAVTINALGGALSDSAAQRYIDTMNDPNAWTVTEKGTGATWTYLTGVADALTSQRVGEATGYNRLLGNTVIPYEPGVLYRLSARVRLKAGTSETFYVGIAGIGADGKTLVNRTGVAGSGDSHYYVAASARTITQADGWVQVIGFVKDRAAAGSAGPNNDPRSPGVLHNDVRFISPYVWLNYNGIGGTTSDVMQVDCVTLEALKTGLVDSINFTAGAVNTAALAADAVTAGKIAADAISARELQAASVTAQALAAGSITADKLVALAVTAEKVASLAITTDKLAALSITADKMAVNSVTATAIAAGSIDATHVKAGSITADRLSLGTDGNVLPDPSFEGAISDQRVAGSAYWSLVTPGNGTPRALRVSAVNTTLVTRSMTLATLPAVPGQKIWLGMDYLASTDWNGVRISLYGQWLDSSGNILGYSTIATGDGLAVKGAWTRLTGLPTDAAPTGTTQLRVACSTVDSTTGTVQYDNTSCRIVMASGVAGARAEISPQGLQLYDEAGEEAVALMTGRPNYLTLSSDGLPVATIDQNGGAGFQRLMVAEGFTVGGADWMTYIDQLPRGILSIDYQASTVTASGSELGFVELSVDIDPTRMYRIVLEVRANPSVAGGELQLRLRNGGGGAPTITSPQLHVAIWPMAVGNSFTARLEHIVPGSDLGAGTKRLLISFVNAFGPSGQTIALYGASTSLGKFYVEDIGPHVPETGQYNTGGGSTTPPVQKYTKTYACSWSGSYTNRGSYNSYYGNSCYQGYYSSTNGTQGSLIGFPSSLGTDLSGATIQKADVYLYFDHWYSNSGGKAVIKAHSFTSRPSTFSSDPESQTISWARNEGKWVDITSVFDSTKWRGIALDPNSTSSTYYGRARGYGQTNPPKLRVTYTK